MTWSKRYGILSLALILSVIGILLIFYFACGRSFSTDPELASNFGDFISGVVGSLFTLVGFLLLYQTILEQREQFRIQQFEMKLFELIKFHRENVDKMKFTSSYNKNGEMIEGRDVIVDLKKQCVDLYHECSKILVDYDQSSVIEISYLIFYFGVSLRTIEVTKQQLKHRKLIADEAAIASLINQIREKKTKYNDKIVFYGGHQSKLGFYFRQIYQTIKFIDECDYLSSKEKIKYVKLFRAQLTTYEQGLLFFNSISPLGSEWKNLIEKYELVKNIPPAFLDDIDVKRYYGRIDFEFDWS